MYAILVRRWIAGWSRQPKIPSITKHTTITANAAQSPIVSPPVLSPLATRPVDLDLRLERVGIRGARNQCGPCTQPECRGRKCTARR